MNVDEINLEGGVLNVACSGVFGVGSQGTPSARKLTEAVKQWMRAHPDRRVEQIVVDYTRVDYEWGDGPISSLISLFREGVANVRLVASVQNKKALVSLVESLGIPNIEVDGPDA